MPQSFFADAYEGTPPWDIGRPQPEIVRLVNEKRIYGRVLDLGCGTGENALFIASRGFDVLGIDAVPRAIELALKKAYKRRVVAGFGVRDVLTLEALGERFDTGIDCGLFHTFSDAERRRYVKNVARALVPGARLFLLCFSDEEDRPGGPRRVSREEIRQSFDEKFEVESIVPTRFLSHLHEDGSRAWFATLVHR